MAARTPFGRLMEEEVRKAELEMGRHMSDRLFGPAGPPLSPNDIRERELKYGYGRLQITGSMLDTYRDNITKNIFQESPLLNHLKKETKEMAMTTIVSGIRADMNHDKSVKTVKRALKKFEGSWLYDLKRGAHIGFHVKFENIPKKYRYAALFDGKFWHLTGARSPQGITTDDLVDWLIGNGVSFKTVELYLPAVDE